MRSENGITILDNEDTMISAEPVGRWSNAAITITIRPGHDGSGDAHNYAMQIPRSKR